MDHSVDLLSRHARLDSRVPCIDCSSRNFADCTDLLEVFCAIHRHLLVGQLLETRVRRSRLRVIWLLDVVRYLPMASEGVRERSQRSSELEARFDLLFSLLVDHLVHLPHRFEAGLRAVVTRLQLHLQTRRALHRGWLAALRVFAQMAGHFQTKIYFI